jgi:formylglycine-generating enzyme required for sulfatase activity
MLVLLSACSSGTTVSDKDIPDANGQREIASDVPPVDVVLDVHREIDWKGTDTQWDIPQTECLAGQGHFGCPCVGADDCLSGWCQLHLGDMVCTQVCVTECPDGFSCVTVGATDPVSICTSRFPSLCLPCSKNDDCQGITAKCLNYGTELGAFCGQDCLDSSECPPGYECTDGRTLTGAVVKACVIAGMECPCTQYATGTKLKTECSVSNTYGTCPGTRSCSVDGLTECNARIPAEEICDGEDNDCNGQTDEGNPCDDANPCTTDTCLGADGCHHEPAEASCDDGDPCTLNDTCQAGTCVGGTISPLCQAICGDGVCSTLENPEDCLVDCGSCGDGVCGLNELIVVDGQAVILCAQDCLAACGDGKCVGGEHYLVCPVDCGGCGDGLCGLNESPETCLNDCPFACGNGTCDPGENPQVCPVDCMSPCGDGVCGYGENPVNCPTDCTICGDGICGLNEDKFNCAMDCDTACGNGICEGGETSAGCPVDCGFCGDGVCGYHERPDTCLVDCTWGCGDGQCGVGETCQTCPVDCGQCVCQANCTGKQCGSDGCGGTCGTCPEGLHCESSGSCSCDVACTPQGAGGPAVTDEHGITWAAVPAGCFCMGCSPGDHSCSPSEHPSRQVHINAFWMMTTEVSEILYAAVMESNPSNKQLGDNYPVESVDWNSAQQFCQTLGGRLPTEAEWEYAARAGTTSRFTCGDSIACVTNIAWYHSNSNLGNGWQKQPVGTKQCNAWGLCDMIGNVFEWVEDCWHGTYDSAPTTGYPPWTTNCTNSSRIARGGGFSTNLPRVSVRIEMADLLGASFLGFRCAKAWCGSGTCDPAESCDSCPADCGECCGNGICEWDYAETCATCSADCACLDGEVCDNGSCCTPQCHGKECGDDGCAGNCGSCSAAQTCTDGQCIGGGDVTPGFVHIPAGSFWMGSPDGTCPPGYSGSCTSDLGRATDGRENLHYVQLTRPFEMQAHEVTQGEWKAAFGGTNPSSYPSCGDHCPVETVSWFSLLQYANALSASMGFPACYTLTGCSSGTAAAGTLIGCTVTVTGSEGNPYECMGYRLPTEAEWEHAYRAGSSTAFHPSPGNDGSISQTGKSPLDSNLDEIGWYGGNARATYSTFDCSTWYSGATTCGPQPVGGKAANAWGLYDMSGNLYESVWDWYDSYPDGTASSPSVDPVGSAIGSYRANRGGSWYGGAPNCRGATRSYNSPDDRVSIVGARLARSLF